MKDSTRALNEINKSFSIFMSFLKDTVRNNSVQFCRSQKLDISDKDLRKLLLAIDSSIEQAFTNGYGSVQKTVRENLADKE